MYNYYEFSKGIKPSYDFVRMVLDSNKKGITKAQRRLLATYWLAYYRRFKSFHTESANKSARSNLSYFLAEIREIAI